MITLGQIWMLFFPFDASIPIPLNLFIQAAIQNISTEKLTYSIKHSTTWKKVKGVWEEKLNYLKSFNEANPNNKKELPELSDDEKIAIRISEIYQAVKNLIDPDKGQKIPALYLDFENLSKDKNPGNSIELEQEDSDEEDGNLESAGEIENSADEIANLFIRLNSGGTPIRGEELNYSILKANIERSFQDKLEIACKGIMKPQRFITIAFRLFQQSKKEENRDALTMRIKPKQFQNAVNQDLQEFKKYLSELLKITKTLSEEHYLNIRDISWILMLTRIPTVYLI